MRPLQSHAALLLAAALSVAALAGCRPQPDPAGESTAATPPAGPLPLDAPAASGTLAPGLAAPRLPVVQERRLHAGGVLVTSLTYDSRVFFDTDRDQPRPEAAPVLAALAARLSGSRPPPLVAILGHTDATGGDAYNMALSARRARAVLLALERLGVDPGTMQAVAVGKRQPVATDRTDAGRAQNRRVEFLISPSARAISAVLRARPRAELLRARRPEDSRLQARTPEAVSRAPLVPPVSY